MKTQAIVFCVETAWKSGDSKFSSLEHEDQQSAHQLVQLEWFPLLPGIMKRKYLKAIS